MTEIMKRHCGIALAVMLALVPAASSAAENSSNQANQQADQSASGASGGNAAGMAPENVTDQELEKFVSAFQQMQQVRAEYGKKMQQATNDKSKQQQLRKEGQQEMVSAIRDQGLKIAEYRQIGLALNKDKELRARLRSMMQEKQGGNSGDSESGSG